MPKILQNLRECATGMLNDSLLIDVVAMNIGYLTRVIPHLRKHFQATGCTEDRPRIGRPREPNTTIFGSSTCTMASKLPQLLLLTPLIHIITVCLPLLWAIACAKVGYMDVDNTLVAY
jgi:hypothetical protein